MIADAKQLSSQAWYWSVQRADGVGLATTSHDRSADVEGVTYEAAPDFTPDELILSDRLFGSELSFSGPLVSRGLRRQDVVAGRWSGASIQLAVGDWRSASPPTVLCGGQLGLLRIRGEAFTAKLDLKPEKLREQACPQTSPECRAMLGDRQCRVDLRERRQHSHVSIANGAALTLADATDLQRFRFGRLRWLSGKNAGLEHDVVDVAQGWLRLREEPAYEAEPGDRVLLTDGCDKRLQTCSERFHNVANFRGEPHLPGTDLLTRYPGA